MLRWRPTVCARPRRWARLLLLTAAVAGQVAWPPSLAGQMAPARESASLEFLLRDELSELSSSPSVQRRLERLSVLLAADPGPLPTDRAAAVALARRVGSATGRPLVGRLSQSTPVRDRAHRALPEPEPLPRRLSALYLRLAEEARQDPLLGNRVELLTKAAAFDPGHAAAQRELGAALLGERRYDAAAEHLYAAQQLDPQFAETPWLLAAIARHKGLDALAATQYRRALALRSDWPQVQNDLAWLLATSGDAKTRDAAEAVRLAREALALDLPPADRASLFDTLAVAESAVGNFDAARAALEAATNALPPTPDATARRADRRELFARRIAYRNELSAQLELGYVALRESRGAEARRRFDAAARLSPRDPEILAYLGIACLKAGAWREAAENLSLSLELKPQQTAVTHDLARLYATCKEVSLRRPEEALRLAELVSFAERGEHVDAQTTLAAALAVNGRYEEAIRVAREALRLPKCTPAKAAVLERHLLFYEADQPLLETAQGFSRLAPQHLQAHRPRAARAALDAALELAPRDAALRRLRATVLGRLGEDAAAVADLRAVLAAAPGAVDAKNDLAWLLATSPQAAVRAPAEAVRLAAEVAAAGRTPRRLDTAAAAHAAAGDFASAIRAGEQALELVVESDPPRAAAFRLRLEAYRERTPFVADPRALSGQAQQFVAQGDWERAAVVLAEAAAIDPYRAEWHAALAAVELRRDRPFEALTAYRRALEVRPDWPEALNDLAWLLATHPDERVRSPAAARDLAEQACQVTQRKQPRFLDTLAAACAASGDFAAAEAVAREALAFAEKPEWSSQREAWKQRLARYRTGQVYVQPVAAPETPAAP